MELLISTALLLGSEEGSGWETGGSNSSCNQRTELSARAAGREGTWWMSCLPLEGAFIDAQPLQILLDSGKMGFRGAGHSGCVVGKKNAKASHCRSRAFSQECVLGDQWLIFGGQS